MVSRTPRITTFLLCLAAALLPGCAATELTRDVRTQHMVLRSNLDPGEASSLAQNAETALAAIATDIGLPLPEEPFSVLVFDRMRNLRSYLKDHCPDRARSPAAFFRNEGAPIIVVAWRVDDARLKADLRHELTHYLISEYYRDVPPWIHEGLARRAEGGESRVRDLMRALKRPGAVERLISVRSGGRLRREEYDLACAVVARILASRPDGMGLVRRYLKEVDSLQDPVEEFRAVFGISPAEIETALRQRLE